MTETVCPKCAAKIEALEVQLDYVLRHWAWMRLRDAAPCATVTFDEMLADCRRRSDPTVCDGEA